MAQHPTSASPDDLRAASATQPDDPRPASASLPQNADDPGGAGAAVPTFRERLFAPWWLWLLGVCVAVPLAAEVYLGAPGQPLWLPYAVLVPLVLAILVWLGRIPVRVAGGDLHVDDAHLPVRYIGRVGVLDAQGKRDALGIHADPLAFVVQRPWIRDAVLVVLDDPEDPTPYWLVSSRRPRQLAEALLAAKAAANQ